MSSEIFTDDEKNLLMALQFNFPLSEDPFVDTSEFVDLGVQVVFDKIQEFLRKGIIKRIGAQLNYKAFRKISTAALVGARVDAGEIERVARIINSYNPKHNFLRDGGKYNVWFTIKDRNIEELRKKVEEIAEKCGFVDYVFLPSKRVYKMDVKYDLFRGVSYSEMGIEKNRIPDVDDLGISANLLLELERNFPICRRPFRDISQKYGYEEGELISIIEELIELRVIRDFYAVLKERKIGFRENGMTVIQTDKPEKVALKLLKKYPEITHLVQRYTNEKWNYPVYFMVHAIERSTIEEIRESLAVYPEIISAKTLYSSGDLKNLS